MPQLNSVNWLHIALVTLTVFVVLQVSFEVFLVPFLRRNPAIREQLVSGLKRNSAKTAVKLHDKVVKSFSIN